MGSHTSLRYDTSIDGLCNRIATRLNDTTEGRENHRWSKPFLRSVVCDTLWALSRLNPSLFTKKVELPLVNGESCQTIPDECSSATELLHVYDKDSRTTIPIEETNYDTVKRSRYYPRSCPLKARRRRSPGGLLPNITAYSIGRNAADSRDLIVSPIPPEGANLCLVVRCTTVDDLFDETADGNLPSELRAYFPAITELALYMALSMDRDSATLLALANGHLNAFTQLTNLAASTVLSAVNNSGN